MISVDVVVVAVDVDVVVVVVMEGTLTTTLLISTPSGVSVCRNMSVKISVTFSTNVCTSSKTNNRYACMVSISVTTCTTVPPVMVVKELVPVVVEVQNEVVVLVSIMVELVDAVAISVNAVLLLAC
jgi:hypothetical protein